MAAKVADILKAQALFDGLEPADLERLAALARPRRWSAGTVLFQRGDPGREMILVTEGRIRLSVLSPDGRELSLRHAEKGAPIGEMAVLDGSARSADATAVTDAAGLVIGKADLDRLTAERPAILRAFVTYLCGRLRDTTDQMESIALYRLEARLARMLLAVARQQGEPKPGTATRIEMPLNQSEIADMIGASRPRVNGAFMALEEAGAIRRDGSALICRLSRLTEIGEGGGS